MNVYNKTHIYMEQLSMDKVGVISDGIMQLMGLIFVVSYSCCLRGEGGRPLI